MTSSVDPSGSVKIEIVDPYSPSMPVSCSNSEASEALDSSNSVKVLIPTAVVTLCI